MSSDLFENFLLGIVVSAVPGAVFIETIRRTLVDKKTIVDFLVGSFVGMLIILVAVFSGVALLIRDTSTANIFYGVCGAILIALGISSMIKKPSYTTKNIAHIDHTSGYTAFGTGLLISVVNPVRIILLISVVGKILSETDTLTWAVANSLSFVSGSIVLFITLVTFVHIVQAQVKLQHLTLLSRTFGIILLGFGLVTFSRIT